MTMDYGKDQNTLSQFRVHRLHPPLAGAPFRGTLNSQEYSYYGLARNICA